MKLDDLIQVTQIPHDKELTASDIEELIAKLMTLRSQTEPSVHRAPPTPADAATRSTVIVQRDPDISFAALADGGIRLWLRHTGLGWTAVQFSADKARLLRDYLIKWVPGTAPIHLINDEGAGGNRLQ
jgi:hypothetical protein